MKHAYATDLLWMDHPLTTNTEQQVSNPYIVRFHGLTPDKFAIHCGFKDTTVGGLHAGALFKTKEQAEAYINEHVPDYVRKDAFVTTINYTCLRKKHYYYMVASDGTITRKKYYNWGEIK